jgi:hypothetical protein
VRQFRDALADADLRPMVVVFLVASPAFSGLLIASVSFVAGVVLTPGVVSILVVLERESVDEAE